MRIGNLFKFVMMLQGIEYGRDLNLYGFPIIVKNKSAKIMIGEHVHIKSSFLSNLVGLYSRSIICARDKGHIAIGNGVGMSGVTIYARKKIVIGDRCILGGNVKILDNDFHPVDPKIRYESACDNFGISEVIIGSNVFIGCNSIILKGVHIGDNAVIGAGSVVTTDVPCNCLYAGNPARFVKNLDQR